jgi:hypothetical protein
MSTSSEELLELDKKQKLQAKLRQDAARQLIADEQAAHRETVAKETAEKKTELELMLGELTKGEQRTVRLEAYLYVLKQGYDHAQLQSSVDSTTLRLARYMVSGDI